MQGGHDHIGGFVDKYTSSGGKLANPGHKPKFTPWPPTDNNFQPALAAIQQSNAAGVFTFYAGPPAIQFVKQYKQFGLAGKIPLFASGALTEGSLLDAEGEAAVGIKNSNPYAVDLDNAANRKFVSEYQKQYQKLPTTYVMTGYDAAYVLDKAIGSAGSNLTGESVNNAIAKIGQIDSPRGPWQFDEGHTPLQKWYLREVQKDGRALSNVLVQELGMFGTGSKA
jgi:branched-chain amino acid transport system substrate-binding protein